MVKCCMLLLLILGTAAGLAQADGWDGRVSVNSLRVRSGGSLGAPVVTGLAKGEIVAVINTSTFTETIEGITAPWAEVVGFSGDTGWAFSGFIEKLDQDRDDPLPPFSRLREFIEKKGPSKSGRLLSSTWKRVQMVDSEETCNEKIYAKAMFLFCDEDALRDYWIEDPALEFPYGIRVGKSSLSQIKALFSRRRTSEQAGVSSGVILNVDEDVLFHFNERGILTRIEYTSAC